MQSQALSGVDPRIEALGAAGLYVLFDPRKRRHTWHRDLAALAAAGVPWFQLRAKGATPADLRRWAPQIRSALAGAVWILNDDPYAARRIGADGVHVGPGDPPAWVARRVLGAHALIGISGDDRTRLASMGAGAADYAGIGAWRPTASKADVGRALGPVGAERARRLWPRTAVAIGGLVPADAVQVKRMGFAAMAVYSGVWCAPDPVAAAAAYLSAWAAA